MRGLAVGLVAVLLAGCADNGPVPIRTEHAGNTTFVAPIAEFPITVGDRVYQVALTASTGGVPGRVVVGGDDLVGDRYKAQEVAQKSCEAAGRFFDMLVAGSSDGGAYWTFDGACL